ncbi:two-component system, OmpR family, response regulator TrcR [Herbiconiux ginsengi]|uniref:Two-component system, OmpR family, response regulator TrcR n=2 Tax=Herbiconiux ginsengi TaxID=381665 RepID=A0A1H3KUJ4_9MICO|nr:two-component system, OmpR family, response regulator TrcR [Herbiconiux ginsengi]
MNLHRSVEFRAGAGDHGTVADSPISDELVTSGRRRAVLAKLPRMYRADGSAIRVLLVDDEVVLTSLVSLALAYEGWVVDIAHDGATALQKYRDERPDVVVLDIMLPDTDGIRLLRQLREVEQSSPTLFLTARDSVDDRIVGLTAGGDDYMTKPFSLEELVARLRGLLRRSITTSSDEDSRIVVGDLLLDETSYEVNRGGDAIQLTTTEFELLRYLMRNPRRVLSRAQILDRVWNYDFAGKASIVDLYVSYLRKKIDAGRPSMIHTVRGVGYVLRPAE